MKVRTQGKRGAIESAISNLRSATTSQFGAWAEMMSAASTASDLYIEAQVKPMNWYQMTEDIDVATQRLVVDEYFLNNFDSTEHIPGSFGQLRLRMTG